MTSSRSIFSKWPLPLARALAQGARYLLVVLLVCHLAGRLQAPELDIHLRDLHFVDFSGEVIEANEFHGKPVVVQVWSSWCRACMIESGLLSRFADNNDDVVVLGLNVDRDPDEAQAAAKRWGIRYPIVSEGASNRLYPLISQLPTTLVFDSQGECIAIHAGLISGLELAWYLR